MSLRLDGYETIQQVRLSPTVWTDLTVPFTRDRQGVAQKPDYDFTNMGLLFPQNDATEIVYITVQFGHERKPGTNIQPHIHWVQSQSDIPTWKIDYRWYENGSDPLGSFTTLTANTNIFTYTSGDMLQITTFPEIDGSTHLGLSSMLDIKFYREDNLIVGDVLGKEFDIHYQVDTMGSVTTGSKY